MILSTLMAVKVADHMPGVVMVYSPPHSGLESETEEHVSSRQYRPATHIHLEFYSPESASSVWVYWRSVDIYLEI